MISPELSWLRFAQAFLLGMGMGPVSDFLSPVRRRFSILVDGILSVWMIFLWLILTFGICGGDLRIGYCGGAVLGFALWRQLVSPHLRRMFSKFWRIIARISALITAPAKKILKEIKKFLKKLFATGKKWVTIGGTTYKNWRNHGGTDNDRCMDKNKKGSSEIRQSPPACEDSDLGGHYIVYRDIDHRAADSVGR